MARGTRHLGPAYCHGLAGSIDLLLDLFRATGEDAYLAEARSLGRLLRAFVSEREGHLVCAGDVLDLDSPDYLVG